MVTGDSGSTGNPREVPGGSDHAAPALRASDAERHRVAELLGEHAAAGRITLAELEDRVGRAYTATNRSELAELTKDLPAHDPAAAPAGPPARRARSQWLFAIMGGSTRRRTRRLAGQVNLVSIMGGDDLDLREVEIEGGDLVINTFSLMGGPTIYLPDTVQVELSGPAIMGGNDQRGSARPPRPGAPMIRIRSVSVMGGTDVWRLPAESRGLSLKAARRAAKALEQGRG